MKVDTLVKKHEMVVRIYNNITTGKTTLDHDNIAGNFQMMQIIDGIVCITQVRALKALPPWPTSFTDHQ